MFRDQPCSKAPMGRLTAEGVFESESRYPLPDKDDAYHEDQDRVTTALLASSQPLRASESLVLELRGYERARLGVQPWRWPVRRRRRRRPSAAALPPVDVGALAMARPPPTIMRRFLELRAERATPKNSALDRSDALDGLKPLGRVRRLTSLRALEPVPHPDQ